MLLTALILMPVWLGRGFVLNHDMVAVPQQQLQPWMWGGGGAPPRAVPQDVYIAVLDNVIPGALLQKLLLTIGLLGSAWAMAWLAAPFGRIGQAVAATVYVWSVYVFERLAIGHFNLVLAYAALAWVVLVANRARRGSTSAAAGLVLIVAAATWAPTPGVMLVVVAAALILWPGSALEPRARVATVLALVATQLTWIVPALLTAGAGSDSRGLFGLRSSSLGSALLQVLQGGGIWSATFAAPSRAGALGVIAVVIALVMLILGLPRVRAALGSSFPALLTVALLFAAWAVITGVPALSDLVTWVEGLPGGGLLRDGQKWLAPLWLVVALSFGAAAQRIQEWMRGENRALPYALALLPLVLLPDLAWGLFGRLEPVRYPAGWQATAEALAAAPDDDDVVALPWSAFRRFAWNDQRTVLDPAPRYLPRTVVADTTLLVAGAGPPDGSAPAVVAGDDPASAAAAEALRSSDPLGRLRAQGIGWVFVEEGQPAAPDAPPIPDLSQAELVVRADDVSLYRLPGAVADPPSTSNAAIVVAWTTGLVVCALALWEIMRTARVGARAQRGR